MFTKKPTREDRLTSRWKNYKENLVGHVCLANEVVIKHNDRVHGTHGVSIAKNNSEIREAEDRLDKMNKIKEDLDTFALKAKEVKGSEPDKKIKCLIEEVKDNQCTVLLQIIQLNKILSDKYMFLVDKVKKNERHQPATKAYQYLQAVLKLHDENKEILPDNFDHELKTFEKFVTDNYKSYVKPSEIDPENKVETLLTQARNMSDVDRAYEKFQEAVDLAKSMRDPFLQFLVLWEQGKAYNKALKYFYDGIINLDEINRRQAILKKISNCYISAMEVKNQIIKNANGDQSLLMHSESIALELHALTNLTLKLATHFAISKNIDKREELIKEAVRLKLFGAFLVQDIQQKQIDFSSFDEEINQELQIIFEKKARLENEKQQREEQELLKNKLQEEYEAKFTELLNAFPMKEKVKVKTKNNDQVSSNSKKIHSSEETDDDITLDAPDEELIQPVYVNFEQQQTNLFHPHSINLETHLEQLESAKKSGDVTKQIQEHSHVADAYRIKALQCLRHRPQRLKWAIEYLENAKNHLSEATMLIDQQKQMKNGNDNDYDSTFINLEQATSIVLENTEALLAKTITRQRSRTERLNQIHDEVKAYLIDKYGRDRWFKYSTFDWNSLSPHAQNRLKSRENLAKLHKINTEIHQLISHMQNQISAAERQLIEGSAMMKQPVQIDFHDIKNRARAAIKYNFFNPIGRNPLQLTRSLSYDSFFDPVEVSIRDYEKKTYGRG